MLTVSQYAYSQKITRQTVYNRIRKGLIRSKLCCGKLMIDEDFRNEPRTTEGVPTQLGGNSQAK